MSEQGSGGRKWTAVAAALVFAAVLCAYSNSFRAGFHFDDFHQITKNKNVQGLSNIPRFFTSAELGSFYFGLKGYRPVTCSSFALNYAVSGYDVWSYHVFNALLHFMNSFIVFILMRRLFGRSGMKHAFYAALAASLFFAVHPIQTQAVTYISGRAVLLASFFYLLSFLCFLKYRDQAGGAARVVCAATAPVLYLLGLFSKEMAASLPAMMLAYDIIFTVPERGGFRKAWKAWLYYIPLAAVLIFFIGARMALEGFVAQPDNPMRSSHYLMSEAKVLLMYIRLLALPVNQDADYYLPFTFSPDLKFIVSGALLAGLLFFLIKIRKRSREASFLGIWFFIALAPESTLVPIPDIAVEYRLYLASAGFAGLAAFLTGRLAGSRPRARWPVAAVLAMMLVLTVNRNRVWADELTLWRDTLRKSPRSDRAHANLGTALMVQGRFQEAVEELGTALKIKPLVVYEDGNARMLYAQRSQSFVNLGICYREMGRYGESARMLGEAVKCNPRLREAYMNLAATYFMEGKYEDAVDTLLQVVGFDPAYTQAYFDLAENYTRLGRHFEALRSMREAARLEPGRYDAHYNLAVIYKNNGMDEDARSEVKTALALAANEGERKDAEEVLAGLGKGGR